MKLRELFKCQQLIKACRHQLCYGSKAKQIDHNCAIKRTWTNLRVLQIAVIELWQGSILHHITGVMLPLSLCVCVCVCVAITAVCLLCWILVIHEEDCGPRAPTLSSFPHSYYTDTEEECMCLCVCVCVYACTGGRDADTYTLFFTRTGTADRFLRQKRILYLKIQCN